MNSEMPLGTHVLTTNAVGPNGLTIASPSYTFNLTIKDECDPPGSITAPTITAGEATLDGGANSFSWDAWTTEEPAECTLAYTVTIPEAISTIVTADLTARTLAVSGNDGSLAGVYKITITAATSTGDTILGPYQIVSPYGREEADDTAEFTLTLKADTSTSGSTPGSYSQVD